MEAKISDAKREKIKLTLRSHILKIKGGFLTIRGNSMFPTLKENWRIKVIPVDANTLAIGDIITFDRGGINISHRIIDKFRLNGELYLFQKGDNHWFTGMISSDSVVGKVVEVLNENGKRVEESFWQKTKIEKFLYFYSSVFFIYGLLYYLKRKIFGTKRNFITKIYSKLFWIIYLSPFRYIKSDGKEEDK